VALYAAYSLQSHSQRNYSIGSVNDKSKPVTISSVSYDAGWPLKYAHMELQQVPVAAADPTPGRHDIQPGALLVDVLMVGVPFWLLLEAVWLFWSVILRNFGPKRPRGRFFAVGFTMLPGALWLIGGLALGGFL